jgi:AraC-like DNA-binding protein
MILAGASEVRCTRTASARADEETSDLPTLVLPQLGVFRYHVGRRAFVADANTVVLFHPDQPYRITHPCDGGDRCIALRFHRDVVADVLGFASERAFAWVPEVRTHRELHRRATAVLSADDALAREELALDALAMIPAVRAIVTAARDAERIEAVRERLSVGLGESLSLATLAREASLSPFHLARRFRAVTGSSLHQYRVALRLGAAAAMLRNGATEISRLAQDLGFASSAHFSTAFRRAYGRSPRSYAAATGAASPKASPKMIRRRSA